MHCQNIRFNLQITTTTDIATYLVVVIAIVVYGMAIDCTLAKVLLRTLYTAYGVLPHVRVLGFEQ